MFLDELRERGLLEESLVIVSADHGDAFGEHGYYEHPRYLHDGSPTSRCSSACPTGRPTPSRRRRARSTSSRRSRILGEESEFSLLHPPDGDRRVFSQARGEEKHSHIRRYALRTREGRASVNATPTPERSNTPRRPTRRCARRWTTTSTSGFVSRTERNRTATETATKAKTAMSTKRSNSGSTHWGTNSAMRDDCTEVYERTAS